MLPMAIKNYNTLPRITTHVHTMFYLELGLDWVKLAGAGMARGRMEEMRMKEEVWNWIGDEMIVSGLDGAWGSGGILSEGLNNGIVDGLGLDGGWDGVRDWRWDLWGCF